jgi:hypothetical protein
VTDLTPDKQIPQDLVTRIDLKAVKRREAEA